MVTHSSMRVFISSTRCPQTPTASCEVVFVILCWPVSAFLQYLLHYLLSVKGIMNRHAWSRSPISETAWALLKDSYHGPLCVRHPPQHLALAVLYLSLQSYGVELPVGTVEWWQVSMHTATPSGVSHG